jgi:hypothetical protein
MGGRWGGGIFGFLGVREEVQGTGCRCVGS